MIVEKGEGKQAESKFIFEDICEDAPESKIQSVPSLFSVKLFMTLMKVAWSQDGCWGGAEEPGACMLT